MSIKMKNKRYLHDIDLDKESKRCYCCREDFAFYGNMKPIIATSIFIFVSLYWLYQNT